MAEQGALFKVFSVARIILYPFALLYGALLWLRNRMYDAGFFSSVRFSVPVIAVGNLSTGGTGKTPHVEYIIRLLQYRYRVATMSRGYKRRTQGFVLADANANALRIGDEPMQYFMKYPDIAVSVAEERITGIPMLLQRRPFTDAILLDDAYQHRSVKAGLNILITDYAQPFYNDHVLPFGGLRESRKAANRADVIVVSKCPPKLGIEEAKTITSQISKYSSKPVFFTSLHYGQSYNLFTGLPFDLTNTNVVCVCGIARPEPLVAYIEQQANAVHLLRYNDHHYFVNSDLEEIKQTFTNWEQPNKVIVTTEKDATRLHLHKDKLATWDMTIVVVPVEVYVLFNQAEQFNALIDNYVETTIAKNNQAFGFNESIEIIE